MREFVAFVAIGSAFATVEEFLTVVVLRHDLPSYLFTLLVLFPAYLGVVYLGGRILDRLVRREPARELAHLVLSGGLGLLLEWTLMGLAPWSHPAADPRLMLGFQLGMFAFWATVGAAPRVFLDRRRAARVARRRILRFALPYVALVYGVGLSVPGRLRFATLIPLIVVGYGVIMGLLVMHVVDSHWEGSRAGPRAAGPETPTSVPPPEDRPSVAGRGKPLGS